MSILDRICVFFSTIYEPIKQNPYWITGVQTCEGCGFQPIKNRIWKVAGTPPSSKPYISVVQKVYSKVRIVHVQTCRGRQSDHSFFLFLQVVLKMFIFSTNSEIVNFMPILWLWLLKTQWEEVNGLKERDATHAGKTTSASKINPFFTRAVEK